MSGQGAPRPQGFDFDPELPDLPLAFDLEGVARRLEEEWPGARPAPPVKVTPQKILDTKYEPSTRCVVAYALLVRAGSGPPLQTIGVADVVHGGMTVRPFQDDPLLPWLPAAADGARILERIRALPRWAGPQPDRCEVVPLRYKPGSRCVFRFDVSTATGSRVLYGKTFASDSETHAATLTTLATTSATRPGMPRVVGPIAHWPDLRMLLQPAIEGVEVHARMYDADAAPPERRELARALGAGLASFHAAAAPAGPRRSIQDDMAELQSYLGPMSRAAPDLSPRFAGSIDRLRSAAAAAPDAPSVPSHGAFRTDQAILQDGRLAMIDLDGFCRSNPARDIGNFRAYLEWRAIRQSQHRPFVDTAAEAFLAGYGTVRTPPDQPWIQLCEATSLLKIAGRRFRSLTVGEWPLVPTLLDAADRALGA
jgi:hypothetical protein